MTFFLLSILYRTCLEDFLALGPCGLLLSFLSQPLIHLHQLRDSPGLGGGFHVEPIRPHDGAVVLLVGAAQLRGHGHLVVEVGKAGVRIKRAGIEDGLGGLLDLGLLLVGGRRPREVVVDDGIGILIPHLQPSGNRPHPRIMNIGA